MTERRWLRVRPGSRPTLRDALPALFVVLLAVATLVGGSVTIEADGATDAGATGLHAALDAQGRGRMLVAFDADVGTYAEVRPAVRAAFAQLVRDGASLSFVSLTGEGRALALAEIERLRSGGVEANRLLDLGYRAGAEAALVDATRSIVPAAATGTLADALRASGASVGAFDAVLVIGGSDIGPRAWVEQVGPRVPGVPLLAIAPSIALPQASPYLATRQLAALVVGARQVADYVAIVRDDATPTEARAAVRITDLPPAAFPVLLGIVLTLLVLAEAAARPGAAGTSR